MSGITPILDTLLHQVLGKRVDVPRVRNFPEPVTPTSPCEVIQPVNSDSQGGRQQPALYAGDGHAKPDKTPEDAVTPEPERESTRTHFSPAARIIAEAHRKQGEV